MVILTIFCGLRRYKDEITTCHLSAHLFTQRYLRNVLHKPGNVQSVQGAAFMNLGNIMRNIK